MDDLKRITRAALPVADAKLVGEPTVVKRGAAWVVTGQYRVANGALIRRAFSIHGKRLWRVDVGHQPGDGRWATVVQHMAFTARSLEPPR